MKNIAATYKLTSADRGYVVMPLFHIHGLMCTLFDTLYSKGSIVLTGKSVGFQEHLQYSYTWFTSVPTMNQSLFPSPKYYEDAGKPVLRFIRRYSSESSSSCPVPLSDDPTELWGLNCVRQCPPLRKTDPRVRQMC